jgi:hypothetical protein
MGWLGFIVTVLAELATGGRGGGWWLTTPKRIGIFTIIFPSLKAIHSKTYILQDPVHGIAAGVEQVVVHLHVGDELVNPTLLHHGKDSIK